MLVDLQVLLADADVERVVAGAQQARVDALCLVGFRGLPDAHLVRQVEATGKRVFVGAQLPLDKGHILVYPPEVVSDFSDIVAQAPTNEETVSYFKSRGFSVVACHPYFKESTAAMGDRIFQFRGLDAIVVVTAQSPQSANDLAVDALDMIGCPAAAGSAEAAPSGKVATLFVTDIKDQAEFVNELKAGDFWAVALGNEDRWTDLPEAGPSDYRSGDRRFPRRDGDRRFPRRDGDRGGYRGNNGNRRDGRRDGGRPPRSRDGERRPRPEPQGD